MNLKHLSLAGLLGLALSLASCGGGGGGISGTGAPMGTLGVSITDAPACGFNAVNVTIQKVRVNQNANAADSDAGWSEIVLSPAQRIDLLTLNNGALQSLGQTSLPAGTYTQLRLVLAANDSTAPLANSVVLSSNGTEVPLDTPSALQSGLKLNTNINVPAGSEADVLLDFNACKSVVKAGNSGRYNLKPVISVVPLVSDAGLRVIGYVDLSIAKDSTSVSLQSGGVPVKATPPDFTGKFTLSPVPAGTYDLVVTAPGFVTTVMSGVPVVSGTPTSVGTTAVRILPATAFSPRTVNGTVTPASATVRALQTFTGGPTVEVQWAPVDASSGKFQFSLPADAPAKTTYTAYVANPTSFSFKPDPTATATYTLEAASAGATQQQKIDVTNPPQVTFTFP